MKLHDMTPNPTTESGHLAVLRNYANAILKGEALISPGSDGINGVSLFNAIYMSSWLKKIVQLPIDDALYKDLLDIRINSSPKRSTRTENACSEEKTDSSARWQVRW